MLEWIAAAAAAAVAGYGLFIVPTRWLKVERVTLDLGLHIRIVQISDIHAEMLRISPGQLEGVLKREAPDCIMLTGDFTRKTRFLPRLEPYLKVISSMGVPVYAVPGNHDYKMKSGVSRLFGLLERYGVTLLRNESVRLPRFMLVGIDNYGTGHSRIKEAFGQAGSADKIVVITHDPNVVPVIDKSYDYLMAGHLHGKQFNIPFFFKLKKKGALPSRGIYKGLHHSERGYFYISKGMGQAGLNARFLVRSEITVHDL
jgi:uncharacterized protein